MAAGYVGFTLQEGRPASVVPLPLQLERFSWVALFEDLERAWNTGKMATASQCPHGRYADSDTRGLLE